MSSDKKDRIINDTDNNQGVISSTMSSSTSSSTTSTSSNNVQQQQLLQPAQNQTIEDKNESNIDQIIKPSVPSVPSVQAEENVPVVRMRNRPLTQIQQQATTNGTMSEINENNKNSSLAALQRGLEVLNEVTPEDDGNEEIRRLDSQLDHLNHYMDKVEERIKAHNEKLMNTLKHQREEREKRRRSFHEVRFF
uniref:Uncharacterized protein n=1 Tax=Onchocerca volvulus TaxID=6282 RepID=A0A8R1TRN6_ONCVO